MPLHIIREDITKISCDAIVNPTNQKLDGSGSLDSLIHKKAGTEIDKDCKEIGICEPGSAVITKGYNLPSIYVIHTVGPAWIDGKHNEENILKSCYKNSLKLAKKYNCKSIAFPIISSGTYQYPKEKSFNVAVSTIQEFLLKNEIDEIDIYLVVFNKEITYISKKLFGEIKEYIDDHYTNELEYAYESISLNRSTRDMYSAPLTPMPKASKKKLSINDIINDLDVSFSEKLIMLIDEKGMKDSECYKKANVDRKLFNKIKNNPGYHPKKETVIAFAIALELNLKDTQDLLNKAGYTLSDSYKFDLIVKYFIENKMYDIMLINEALFSFDQKLLSN